jgi:hypothetical protein
VAWKLALALAITTLALSVVAMPAADAKPPPRDERKCEGFKGPGKLLNFGYSCFEFDGDDHWVQDIRRNGWGVGADIQTNYKERRSDRHWKRRRCENGRGALRWQECRYNHEEPRDGHVRCVRWRMYEYRHDGPHKLTRNWTGWSSWYRTNTGALEPDYICRGWG